MNENNNYEKEKDDDVLYPSPVDSPNYSPYYYSPDYNHSYSHNHSPNSTPTISPFVENFPIDLRIDNNRGDNINNYGSIINGDIELDEEEYDEDQIEEFGRKWSIFEKLERKNYWHFYTCFDYFRGILKS